MSFVGLLMELMAVRLGRRRERVRQVAATLRLMSSRIALSGLLACLACGSSHGAGDRDGGEAIDGCAGETESGAYSEAACSASSFEFEPFGEVDLSPGPCLVDAEPTTTPFVPVGVWANLERERLLRSPCMRIVAADSGSGLSPGVILPDRIVTLILPYDRVGFEVEMVGLDGCGQVLGSTLRIDSRGHQPPREVLRSDERIVTLPDRATTNRFVFATETRVHAQRDGSVGVSVDSPMPRDLLPSVGARDVWIEGSGPDTALRSELIEASSPPTRVSVDEGARAVRWIFRPGPSADLLHRVVLLEPGRIRVLEPEGLAEERTFDAPTGATDPVVRRSELALSVDGMIRIFDLRTGLEVTDRGFEPEDRLLEGHPPLLLRDQRLSAVSFDEELRVPTWFDRSAPRLEPVLEALGPLRSVVSMNYNGQPFMVTGERAVAALPDVETSAVGVPPVRASSELFGGPVRLARTVWQWRTWVVVDEGPGSVLFEMRHGSPGWRRDCAQFD